MRLKVAGGVTEPEGHDVIDVDPAMSEERGLGSVARLNLD